VVERGETLFSIAQRYGSTVNALAHRNGLHDPTRIYVGQRLRIPTGGVQIEPQDTTSYLVQVGDSLTGIAKRHATTWYGLARLNALISPDVLYAGQVLRVPVVDPVAVCRGGLHLVGGGETLFDVALRYDVSPRSLIVANDDLNPALIYPGQLLIVPGEGAGRLPAPFDAIHVQPLPVSQGESLLIAVRARQPVTLTGSLFERTIRFAEEAGIHYGLVGVHVFTGPGLYEMTLRASDGGGQVTEITTDVVVEADRFGYERIKTSPSLLDPAIVAAERERLDALRPTFSPQRRWSEKLEPPSGGTISSYFGTHRAYNEGPYTSYHGGVDFRGAGGTPVRAPADGTVLLADQLTVRGNALVLDHGWGMMTGYWHLSSVEVGVGQRVEQGDLIARIGNTGLSTGSHLHWEMWVGGVNVNPLQWLEPFYHWPQDDAAPNCGDVP
jgi:murein DD-endopeptidase MepM/ murein hydrolase activator NlpD